MIRKHLRELKLPNSKLKPVSESLKNNNIDKVERLLEELKRNLNFTKVLLDDDAKSNEPKSKKNKLSSFFTN